MAGAVTSENRNEQMMLIETSIMTIVFIVKVWYLIWRKKEILELLNQICSYSVDNRETFTWVNEKSENFMKFMTFFWISSCFCLFCEAFIAPFVPDEKTLFFPIGFPLDWKSNEFAYWMAFTFIGTLVAMTAISILFTTILWYLMANCSWRYAVLGQQMKRMGADDRKISNVEKDNLYRRELDKAITSHTHLKEYNKPVKNVWFQ